MLFRDNDFVTSGEREVARVFGGDPYSRHRGDDLFVITALRHGLCKIATSRAVIDVAFGYDLQGFEEASFLV